MTFVEIGADFIESALFVVYLNLFNARRFRGGKAAAGGFVCFALLFGNILASDMVTLYSYVSTMGLFGSSVIMIWILTPVKDNDILLWMDTMSFMRMLMIALSKLLLLLYAFFLLKGKGRSKVRHSWLDWALHV